MDDDYIIIDDKIKVAHGQGAGPIEVSSYYQGRKVTHIPTTGTSIADKFTKLVHNFVLTLLDKVAEKFFTLKYDLGASFQDKGNEEAIKFIQRSQKHAALMTSGDVGQFARILEGQENRNKGLSIVYGELRQGCAGKMKPREKIMEAAEKENEMIAYPYAFPGGILKYEHVVLVVVDKVNNKIYYYDPQGLSSDDVTRKTQEMNLREELIGLARDLAKKFGGEWGIEENRTKHQVNPVDCGNYVMNAMLELNKPNLNAGPKTRDENIIDRLHMNQPMVVDPLTRPINFDGTILRRKIGKVFHAEHEAQYAKSRPEIEAEKKKIQEDPHPSLAAALEEARDQGWDTDF